MARKPGTTDPEFNLRIAQAIAEAVDEACRVDAVVTWMDLADEDDEDEDDRNADEAGTAAPPAGRDDDADFDDGESSDEDEPSDDDVYFVIDAQRAPGAVETLRELAGARLRVRPRGSVLLMVADLGGDEDDESAPLAAVRIAPEAIEELRRFDPAQQQACRALDGAREALERLLDELPYFAEWLGTSPQALRGRLN